MLYSLVLASAVHHHESATGMHMSPPSLPSLPSLWVVPEHRVEPPMSYSKSHWLSILRMVMHMFPCYSRHSSHPLLLP